MRSSKAATPIPFHYLGLHTEGGRTVVRAFLPEASKVEAIDEHGETAALARIHDAGLFAGALPNGSKRYQLRARFGDTVVDLEDPYRFPPVLTDFDLYLLGEGTHQRLYDKLGAHPMTLDGVDGVAFVVFAPNARRVSVVGDFNFWDARRHPMRVRGNGYWEMFVPRATRRRSLQVRDRRPAGPASAAEVRSGGVCRGDAAEHRLDRVRRDQAAASARRRPRGINALSAPISIYEVHLGSWRRKGNNEWLTYRELAEQLPRLCPRSRLHPCRIPAGQRASVRRLLGLSADRPVRADQPVRHAGGFLPRWSMPAIARASA